MSNVIYLAKSYPETQVQLAAKSVGLRIKKFEGGFLLRAQDGEILPGHYGADEDGVVDTYFGDLSAWSAREVIDYCAMFIVGMETSEFVIG